MNCQIAGAGWGWEGGHGNPPGFAASLVRSVSSLGTPKLVTGISSEHSFVRDCTLKSVESDT